MASIKIFFVYFNALPAQLDDFVRQDGNMSILKDGVKAMRGGKFPRLTVRVKPVSASDDNQRVRDLVNLLQSLQNMGQIISYTQG